MGTRGALLRMGWIAEVVGADTAPEDVYPSSPRAPHRAPSEMFVERSRERRGKNPVMAGLYHTSFAQVM